MVEIVYKNENFVVINKPVGIPSQQDTSLDADAMTQAADILKSLGEPSDLWLIHRLDRVVGGLLVFARNKGYAARLSELVQKNLLTKEYLAVAEGELTCGEMSDYLYKDARQGKSFVVDGERCGAKLARLEYSRIAVAETEKGVKTLVKVRLHTGRHHQIRAQFSSRGHSLVGDGKYGSHDNRAKTPSLFSAHLGFNIGGKAFDFKISPDITKYPWSLFSEEDFK